MIYPTTSSSGGLGSYANVIVAAKVPEDSPNKVGNVIRAMIRGYLNAALIALSTARETSKRHAVDQFLLQAFLWK